AVASLRAKNWPSPLNESVKGWEMMAMRLPMSTPRQNWIKRRIRPYLLFSLIRDAEIMLDESMLVAMNVPGMKCSGASLARWREGGILQARSIPHGDVLTGLISLPA